MGRRITEENSKLEVLPDATAPCQGLIGAALRELPYWTLLDADGEPWGRLGLLFKDEARAEREMRRQLEATAQGMLRHGVVRQVREVDVTEEADVLDLPYDPRLVLELREITRGPGGVRAPASLLSKAFDVARVARNAYPYAFEFAIATEQALEQGLVRCFPGRELVFEAA